MDENFGLNEKQLAFCDYYLQCNNAGMAYKKAYDPLGEKDLKIGGCYTNGCRLLKKENVQNYLTIKRSLIKSERLMETEEILAELNSLALDPSVKPSDRIRALELLGKSKALFSDKITTDNQMAIEINLTGIEHEAEVKKVVANDLIEQAE